MQTHRIMQRTTIMIDDRIFVKLRQIQAKQIAKSNKSVSLSSVINELLEKSTS